MIAHSHNLPNNLAILGLAVRCLGRKMHRPANLERMRRDEAYNFRERSPFITDSILPRAEVSRSHWDGDEVVRNRWTWMKRTEGTVIATLIWCLLPCGNRLTIQRGPFKSLIYLVFWIIPMRHSTTIVEARRTIHFTSIGGEHILTKSKQLHLAVRPVHCTRWILSQASLSHLSAVTKKTYSPYFSCCTRELSSASKAWDMHTVLTAEFDWVWRSKMPLEPGLWANLSVLILLKFLSQSI